MDDVGRWRSRSNTSSEPLTSVIADVPAIAFNSSSRALPSRGATADATAPSASTLYTHIGGRHLSWRTETPPATDFTWAYGYGLLAITYLIFLAGIYALVISKWLPPTNHEVLDWIAQDRYYCYLIPATLPFTVYMVLWNWMSMKFFRHS